MTDPPFVDTGRERTPFVAGIDMALAESGIAFPTGELRKHGHIGISKLPLVERTKALGDLKRELQWLATGTPIGNGYMYPKLPPSAGWPDLIMIEGLELHSKSSAGLAERCHLWFALVAELQFSGFQVVEVPPSSVKMYSTGKGNAGKAEVVDAVARRLPLFETRGNTNLADAAVLCAMGMDLLGAPLAVMPTTHRRALDKLVLPEGVRRA